MARSFNGTTDVIQTATLATIYGSGTMPTISASVWFFTTVSAVQFAFSDYNAGATLLGIQIGLINNSFDVRMYPGGTVQTITAGTQNGSVWNHGCLTYDGATMTSYLNGVSVGTISTTGNVSNSGATVAIGNRGASNDDFWNGNLADAAIWKTALTSGQVTSLVNGVRPNGVNSANIVGWWPLDGYASPETDFIGGNNGTLTGTGRVLGPPALWRVLGS